MAEKIILELIKKYNKDIIMLDALLQWAINPTSMSAVYGIEENYPYIKQNLKITHQLTEPEANEVVEKLKTDCDVFLKLKKDKYSIGNFQKFIIKEISKPNNSKLFEKFILKKRKKASKNAIRFLQTYHFCPIKNFPCVNVQFNAIYGEEIHEEELVILGILKPLYWISSGTNRNSKIIPKFIPILDDIIGNLKLKEIKIKQPKVAEFIRTLKENRDRATLNFIIGLIKKNFLCDYLNKNQEITLRNGIVGFYSDPYSNYAGISFLAQEELTKLINNLIKEELKQKTEKIIKILQFEMEKEEKPSGKELIRIADLNIEDIEVYEELMNQLPKESFSENQEIRNKASEAIKKFDDPSLYDLLLTLNYDIETARKVGKYLIDSNMINEFSRVPKEISSSTSLIISQKSSQIEMILCNNCITPLSDRDNPIYCPFCGSNDIIRKFY